MTRVPGGIGPDGGPTTPHFVVIAEFLVQAGKVEAFLAHAFEDARQSLAREPGCLQFDVLRAPEDPASVLFYEVYETRQAFDTHLAMPHVERFRALLADHVQAERPVRMFERPGLA